MSLAGSPEYTLPLVLDKAAGRRLPASASLELPRGALRDGMRLAVEGPGGRRVPSQARPLFRWPDGSPRWVHLVFETEGLGGEARVVTVPDTPRGTDAALATQDGTAVVVDTGVIAFRLEPPDRDPDRRRDGVLTGVTAGTRVVTGRSPDAGLVITGSDGRIFSSQKAGPGFLPLRWDAVMSPRAPLATYGIQVVESGPVRALIRIEGRTAWDAYRGGLDYRVYLEAYRGRSLVRLSVAWIHRDDEVTHFVRDIRFRIPLAEAVTRAVVGTHRGPLPLAVRPLSRYQLLQADHDVFIARRADWDGRVFALASGGANGSGAPGWAWLAPATGAGVGVHLPGFREEHPNEIVFHGTSLEVGLWPGDAVEHFRGRPVLKPLLDGVPDNRHRKLVYECLVHHPYRAFLEPSLGCLETVQGMQKTQEICLDLAAPDAEGWAGAVETGELDMPRARPRAAPSRRDANLAAGETALERAAAWVVRYPEMHGISGKFDRGDLYYLVHAELDDTAWRGALEEHPRSGYWNNNEEDPVHGLHLHVARTGDPVAAATARVMGSHLWDVDVRHHPPWGVHTHTEGHCFRSQAWTATDHFWLEGLVDHAVHSALPDVMEGVREVAAVAARALESVKPAEADLRTVSLAIAQYVRCGEALGDREYVERAADLARAQAADVHPDGFLTDYGSATGRTRSPSLLFGTLFVEAVAEVERVLPDPELRAAALRQVDWMLSNALYPGGVSVFDPADTWGRTGEEARPKTEDFVGAFQLLGNLAVAHRWTGEARYLEAGRGILRRLVELQAPDGDWSSGSVHWVGDRVVLGPPAEGRGQIRPLGPATALRCLPGFLDALGRSGPD